MTIFSGDLLITDILPEINHVIHRRQQQLKAKTDIVWGFPSVLLPLCVNVDDLRSTRLAISLIPVWLGSRLVAGMEFDLYHFIASTYQSLSKWSGFRRTYCV